MKHTPGPWRIKDAGNLFPRAYTIRDASLYPVCYAEKHCEIGNDGLANAHLIAAAPDLLQACEKALELIYQFGPRNVNEYENVKNIQQAIQKAKGGAT